VQALPYGFYPRYRLLVAYFLGRKGWSVDQLLQTRLTEEEATAIMRADTLAMRDVSLAWVMPDQSVRTVGTGWKEQREYLAHQSSRIGDLLVGTQPLIKRP